MLKKKILIVDDEPFFVEVLTTRLAAAGYGVSSARNGDEAFAKAKSEKPHLIIMDVMMPQTSGFEAMQRIRQDPGTRGIPAIIFSGKAGMKEFFQDIPDVEFLHKPFDIKLLFEKIQSLIGGAQPGEGQLKHAILAGVEEAVMNKIRDFFVAHNFQVLMVLNEDEAVVFSKKFRPDVILCQFWEDAELLDPQKIAQELLRSPLISDTPFYVYCKESLVLDAMKHFKPERIIGYKENSDLLRKLELFVK